MPRTICIAVFSDAAAAKGEPAPSALRKLAEGPDARLFGDPAGRWGLIATRGALRATAEVLVHSKLIAHRAPYDLAAMAEWVLGAIQPVINLLEQDRVWDTAVREALIAIARGDFQIRSQRKGSFSLAGLAMQYLGRDISAGKKGADRWQINYHLLEDVPLAQWPADAVEYAVQDAEIAFDVAMAQAAAYNYDAWSGEHYIDDDGNVLDEFHQNRAAFALFLMTAHGVRTDQGRVARTVSTWKELLDVGVRLGQAPNETLAEWRKTNAIAVKRGQRLDAGFIKPDGSRDIKAMRALIEADYASRGEQPPTTEKGATSYSRDTLSECVDPALIAWGEADEYRNYLSKYESQLLTTGPITSYANVLVATGRCSWSDPPLHGPPRKGGYRECHVARPGYALVSIDYNQIELVALGYIMEKMGCGSGLADDIRNGIDLHTAMAAAIRTADTGVEWTYEMMKRDLKSKDREVKKLAKMYRTLAKAANFGLPGGLGARTFVKFAKDSYGVVIDIERAKELIRVYKESRPDVVAYLKIIGSWAGDYDNKTPFSAMQLGIGDEVRRIRGGCGYNDGANTFFQGLVADAIKVASWRLVQRMYVGTRQDGSASHLHGSRAWLLLHDEILLEVPLEKLHDAAYEASKVMLDTMAEFIPSIPAKAEPAAMLRWYKDVETVHDEAGRLIPWHPQETK